MKATIDKIVFFIFGVAVFLGLPMVSWGLTDLGNFFSDPVRLLYTLLMGLATLLVVLFVPRQGRGYGEGEKVVKRQKLTVVFLEFLSILVVIVGPFCDRRDILVLGGSTVVRSAGLVLTMAGYFLMNWAVLVLGRQFSVEVTIQTEHALITSGPFRFIRNPRYLGILLFLLGIALVFRSSVSLVLTVLALIILIWRIHDEEVLLKEHFADRWDEYSRRSWRLIPFIY